MKYTKETKLQIDNILEKFNLLYDVLDCEDNSCPFKRKNKYGVYGMRTNGGCRCFRNNISDPKMLRLINNLVLSVMYFKNNKK